MPEYRVTKQALHRRDETPTGVALNFRHRSGQTYRDLNDARFDAKRMARNIDDEQYETIYITEVNQGTVETWVKKNGVVKTLSVM